MELESRVSTLEQRTLANENRVGAMDTRISTLDSRVAGMDARSEARHAQTQDDIARIETKADDNHDKTAELDKQLAVLKTTIAIYASGAGIISGILTALAVSLFNYYISHPH